MTTSKEILHTKGELWIDDDGFIAIGSGDNYQTFAEIDSRFYAAEKEANKDEMVLRWNSYKRLIDSNRELVKMIRWVENYSLESINRNTLGKEVDLKEVMNCIFERTKYFINNAKNILP